MPNPIVIAVAFPKGGTAKTTTAAHLAHALQARGLNVLAIDADSENESLLRWSELAEWDLPVIALPSATLHKRLAGLVGPTVDAVVIDTPAMDHERGIVTSALRAATHVLIPAAPTTMDFDRVGAVRDLLADLEPVREQPVRAGVLLTQVVSSAASGAVFADLIGGAGLPVLRTRIPRLERYAQAFGAPVEVVEYSYVADELLALDALEVVE